MTDSFLHPDGHHYRFTMLDQEVDANQYYLEDGIMEQGPAHLDEDVAIFERVEPPLWPWTGPSGIKYYLSDNGRLWGDGGSIAIPPEDFAGLAERLAKQAEMKQ